MKTIKRILFLSIIFILFENVSCFASTKYNAFLMGDSIIDNYPHSANGLEYYLKKDTAFNVVCDYSFEGTKVCTDMKSQRSKLVKKLKEYAGKKNVVILSMGTNDYFKKCGCGTNKLFKKRIKEIREADAKAKIIVIVPTHIYRVRNDAMIKSIYEYQLNDKELKKLTVPVSTSSYLLNSDIRSDCLHFTSGGYKKTVKEIKKILGV